MKFEKLRDKRLLLMLTVWTHNPIMFYLPILLSKFLGSIAEYVPLMVYVYLIFGDYKKIKRYVRLKDLIFFGSVCLIYLINYLAYSSNRGVLEDTANIFLLATLPFYFLGLLFDVERYYKELLTASKFVITLQLLMFITGSLGLTTVAATEDFMYNAYMILPHLCFVSSFLVKKFSWSNLLFSFLGFLILCACGNRGAIVCFSLYLLTLLFLINPKVKYLVSVSVLSVLLYANFEFIVISLISFIDSLGAGVSTRALQSIVDNNFADANGRNELSDRILEAIENSGAFGYGIMGDRQFLNGAYVHNIILELLVSYGWVFGILLMLSLIIVILKGYFSSKVFCEKVFLISLVFAGIGKLMFSGTYLTEIPLFIMIGFAVSLIRKKYEDINYIR